MEHPLKPNALTGLRRRFFHPVLAALALMISGTGVHAQTSPAPINPLNPTMKPFAFLFRQSPGQLSEADQKRRAGEVRAWALRQNDEGRKLDPHILEAESHRIGPDGKNGLPPTNDDGPLVAIAFLEARDFSEAIKIAESHPGLRYGVSIEVRAWARPPAPPPAAKP